MPLRPGVNRGVNPLHVSEIGEVLEYPCSFVWLAAYSRWGLMGAI